MKLISTTILFGLLLGCQTAAVAEEGVIEIGQWRTEAGKALVCGGEEADTIIDIATRANTYYSSSAKSGSLEYDAYWSLLEKARNERRCFVTAKMRHLPDSVIYAGPENLEERGKRFKVVGTTIEEDGARYPAFTMTTMRIKKP